MSLLLDSEDHESQFLSYLLYDLMTNDSNENIDTIEQTLTDLTYTNETTTINNNLNCDSVLMNSLTINNNLELDGSFIISNTNYTITDQQFSYLKDIDENIKTKLNNIDLEILDIENVNSQQNTTIGNHTTSINNLNTTVGNHTTSINNLDTLTTQHTTNINSIESDITTINGTLSNYTSQINTLIAEDVLLNSSITSLQSGKQNILNDASRLNTQYIADGSISNLEFQTLNGINTTQTINFSRKFTGLLR